MKRINLQSDISIDRLRAVNTEVEILSFKTQPGGKHVVDLKFDLDACVNYGELEFLAERDGKNEVFKIPYSGAFDHRH